MGFEVVTTPRMRGERLGPRHLDLIAPIFADPRVGATMGGVQSAEQVAQHLAHLDAAWERDGFGYWVFFETVTGDVVARGGLLRTEFDGRPEVEIGWTTAPERWGEGFATELGAISLEVAFRQLGLDDVVAFTLPHNRASRRVMEKLGFVYEKTAPYKVYGDHVLYRRMSNPADTWAGRSPSVSSPGETSWP
jgi:RimJ/RimL family protein N-acetyltransferase